MICHVHSSNRCRQHNKPVYPFWACYVLSLQRIGMDTMRIANVWAFHAYHSPRISNRAYDVSNFYPIVEDNEERFLRQRPVKS